MTDDERNIIVKHRLKRAKNTLLEVDVLIENQMYNAAVNRLYYASYYAVIALLIKHKIKAHTHSGARQIFGLHFVKTGLIDTKINKFYADIFDKRQTGDYDDFVEYTHEEVIQWIEPTKELIREIGKLV